MSTESVGEIRCRACGKEITRQAVRLTSIETDGQADFHHLRWEDRPITCGPLIFARLGRPAGLLATREVVEPTLPPVAKMIEPTGVQIDLNDTVQRYEQRLVRWALEQEQHNQTRAARRLSLQRTTLVQKMRRWGWSTEKQLVES
jgi:DNA-binding NtrC family response regulator